MLTSWQHRLSITLLDILHTYAVGIHFRTWLYRQDFSFTRNYATKELSHLLALPWQRNLIQWFSSLRTNETQCFFGYDFQEERRNRTNDVSRCDAIKCISSFFNGNASIYSSRIVVIFYFIEERKVCGICKRSKLDFISNLLARILWYAPFLG